MQRLQILGFSSPPDTEAPLPRSAWREVGMSAAVLLALLLATATRYGHHRDALYFLEASKHMAWGYVDQPRSRSRRPG
jgi:hypothetical protein